MQKQLQGRRKNDRLARLKERVIRQVQVSVPPNFDESLLFFQVAISVALHLLVNREGVLLEPDFSLAVASLPWSFASANTCLKIRACIHGYRRYALELACVVLGE